MLSSTKHVSISMHCSPIQKCVLWSMQEFPAVHLDIALRHIPSCQDLHAVLRPNDLASWHHASHPASWYARYGTIYYLWAGDLGLLDHDKGRCNQSSLTYIVHRIICHWLKQINRFLKKKNHHKVNTAIFSTPGSSPLILGCKIGAVTYIFKHILHVLAK